MKSIIKPLLLTSLLSFAPHIFAANDNATANTVSPAEKAKIEAVIHEYLITKPEVLVEAMQVLQQRQMNEAQQAMQQTQKIASSFANALFHQTNDPVVGNPNGNITVVEFFDYQCPHCVDMAPVMQAIVQANPNLRVVYKEFPIRGPQSEMAARAALAANKQGKYAIFSHSLLATNKPLSEDQILAVAKQSGLNIDQLKKDMQDNAINKQLKDNMTLGQNLKLFGTPAFFIGATNGKGEILYVPGQMDQKQLQAYINKVNKG